MTGFNDSFGDVISRLEKENAALREEIEELNISRHELDALTKQWYELAENNGKNLVESEAENAALKARAEKAEAKLSELNAFVEQEVYSLAPDLREEGLELFTEYFASWDQVLDHCAIVLGKHTDYAQDPIELFYRIKDKMIDQEQQLARVQERAEKAEADLKSALEEIDRQSFSRHGLEQENAELRAMLKRLQWAAENYAEPACPICWCEEPIHEDDCALAALLKGDNDENPAKTV